jgi:hypothetical protein
MAPPHILVVEDENIIALDIQQRLKTLGYSYRPSPLLGKKHCKDLRQRIQIWC